MLHGRFKIESIYSFITPGPALQFSFVDDHPSPCWCNRVPSEIMMPLTVVCAETNRMIFEGRNRLSVSSISLQSLNRTWLCSDMHCGNWVKTAAASFLVQSAHPSEAIHMQTSNQPWQQLHCMLRIFWSPPCMQCNELTAIEPHAGLSTM